MIPVAIGETSMQAHDAFMARALPMVSERCAAALIIA